LVIRSGAPTKPGDLADWLRQHGYRPGSTGWSSVPGWLEAWAVPLAEINPALLDADPMLRIEWRAPAGSIGVDAATVPSPDDVEDIVDCVAALPFGSDRYAALFATIGMAGMRPSEAIGLRVIDLKLPGTGWGTAAVRGAISMS
jgi:integrase